MTSQGSMFGLGPDQVASLLKLGMGYDPPGPDREQEKADLLRDQLAGRLSDADMADRDPTQNAMRAVTGSSLQDLILGEKTHPAVLRVIKSQGARLSRSAQSEARRQAANVIYYAAIASALVWHEQKISEFSVGDLTASFMTLESLPWLPPRIAQLFHRAVQVCQDLPQSPSQDRETS
jgi:hypothetical protein